MLFSRKEFSDKLNMKDGLNIIIVGCGTVGRTLVEQLSKEGHDITVIDFDSELIREVTNQYDVLGVVGTALRLMFRRKQASKMQIF